MDKPFYILWNPDSHMPPRVVMKDDAEAKEVAEDMARRHKQKFYIMKAVASVEVAPTPVVFTSLDKPSRTRRKV